MLAQANDNYHPVESRYLRHRTTSDQMYGVHTLATTQSHSPTTYPADRHDLITTRLPGQKSDSSFRAHALPCAGPPITSVPMYGRSTSGTSIEPSSRW